MKSEIMDKRYYDFVEAQRFGSSKDDAIAIYMLDMDKPHSMCGLIAGALSEAIDGLKVEASAVFNRSFLAERQKELEQTAPKKQIDKSKQQSAYRG